MGLRVVWEYSEESCLAVWGLRGLRSWKDMEYCLTMSSVWNHKEILASCPFVALRNIAARLHLEQWYCTKQHTLTRPREELTTREPNQSIQNRISHQMHYSEIIAAQNCGRKKEFSKLKPAKHCIIPPLEAAPETIPRKRTGRPVNICTFASPLRWCIMHRSVQY